MIRDTVEAVKRMFAKRKLAYGEVFDKSEASQLVLKDLAKFCRIYDPAFSPDARTHALLEGRREVFLRIMNHIDLSIDELYELHRVKDAVKGER